MVFHCYQGKTMQRRTVLQLGGTLLIAALARPALARTSLLSLREHRLEAVPLGALLRQMEHWRREGYLEPSAVEGYWGPFVGYTGDVDTGLLLSEAPTHVWWLESECRGRRRVIELFASPDPIAVIEPGWRDWLADFAPVTEAEWEMALPLYMERFTVRHLCDYAPDWPPNRMSDLAFTPNARVDRLLKTRRGIVFDKTDMARLLRAAGGDPAQASDLLHGFLGSTPRDYDRLCSLSLGGQNLWNILEERAIRWVYTPYDLPDSAAKLAHLATTYGVVA